MFASVLIANRGEIACRIIRTARAMGLRTIAVASQADRKALHVRMADEAIFIGGARADESYLSAEKILSAARSAGAESIHPGYGFLAENESFAEACAVAGITFVGPPVSAIRTMGRKDEAKALMVKAGVPVLPGFDVDTADSHILLSAAEELGYPVMIKAVAGGGGTGMRRVDDSETLCEALEGVRRESGAAFGDARLILEKCLERPRHIEVQIFSDSHGNCVHMFERDCSLQRRHQKVIEEAPAPGMPEGLRNRMTAAAILAANSIGYVGAGTVEFLTDDLVLSDSSPFYFLEMNTRLQVEHPVTEQVTGLDLVELQLRAAAGEVLGIVQDDLRLTGHAVEARIYAEDPSRGFLPSSGRLHLVRWPENENIRIETGIETGNDVSPFYDPMLAKIIATGRDRAEALAMLCEALQQTSIAGPRTNTAFLHALLEREDVAAGMVDTGLIGREFSSAGEVPPNSDAIRVGIIALLNGRRDEAERDQGHSSDEFYSPWNETDGFTLSPPVEIPMDFTVDGEPLCARVIWGYEGARVFLPGMADEGAGCDGENYEIVMAGDRVFVLSHMGQTEVRHLAGDEDIMAGAGGDGVVRAPMHGRIATIDVTAGARVAAGDRLAVLEAMKMEHVLHAPVDGVIGEISVSEGQQVDEGALVLVVTGGEGS